jgi:sodium/potassium-transporting ATPase subunit alpha
MMIAFFSQCCFFIYMKVYYGLGAGDILLSFSNLENNFNTSMYKTFGTVYSTQSALDSAFNTAFYTGQAYTFASIVILQIFGNLMSTRTHIQSSLFQQVQWKKSTRNLFIHAAQFISCVIMIICIYVTLVNSVFQTAPFDVYMLLLPFGFAMFVLFCDEMRKLFVRKRILWFHKIGW